MVERIYNQISKADFIVADMTGKNPNVFYEVGYAHALDKLVILVTKKDSDIPFDLKQRRHIIYASDTQLRDELERSVRWCIQNPKGKAAYTQRKLELFIGDMPLIENPIVKGETPYPNYFTFDLAIHNLPEKHIKSETFQLAFETPTGIFVTFRKVVDTGQDVYGTASITNNPNAWLFIMEEGLYVLPDSWLKVQFSIRKEPDSKIYNEEMQLAFRLFSEEGTLVFPFRLLIEYRPGPTAGEAYGRK
jgi:hypothetical protein